MAVTATRDGSRKQMREWCCESSRTGRSQEFQQMRVVIAQIASEGRAARIYTVRIPLFRLASALQEENVNAYLC